MIKSRHAILALLTALNLFNYLDRYIVNAVAPDLQAALGLSNSELGIVKGIFMVGYIATCPLFGWLGDRYARKGLIAAGVAAWSVATATSGFAFAFGTLLMARAGVGVGEASYATLSPTIIDDIASPETKNRWLAIFYVAIPVGSALGFLLGGFVNHHWGWRAAFYVAGGPGILLALLTLLIREPERAAAVRPAGVAGAYAAILKRPLFVSAVLGYVAQTFALGGFANWAVEFLYRHHGMELESADRWFGIVTVVTGLGGTALGGLLADRWPGEDRARVSLKVCAWSSLVAAPIALIALFMPTSSSFIIALGVCEFVIFASVAPTNAAVLLSVPNELRASAMALSILAIHVLGDILSPFFLGVSADLFHDAPTRGSGGHGLFVGMLMLPVALALSAGFWWRGARVGEAPAPAGS